MKKFILFICLATILNAYADDLPRQGNWGIYVRPLTDSVKKLNLYEGDGVQIAFIVPGNLEDKLGLKIGDILTQVNDFPITKVADVYFSGFFWTIRARDKIKYYIIRNGKKLEIKGKVEGKPFETHPKAEVIYDKVAFEDGFLRAIITKPKSDKKLPAIYFIPGYNCASYDNMFAFHPYKKIIDSLTNLGYAVFRVEKSGLGDCYNTPNCHEINFKTEQKGFENGYKNLLSYDFIDTSQVYIFGHSLGGTSAPIIAKKHNPKGVIVYGTSHLPWMEYIQNMLRFQNPLLGIDPLEMEKSAKLYQTLLYEHYVQKKSPKELIALNPEFEKLLKRDFQYDGGKMIFNRNYSYMQELNDLNMAEIWSKVSSNVLSIYGEADFEALNPDSHKEIAKIVNQHHPGKATFLLMDSTNHAFVKVGSMEDEAKSKREGTGRQLMMTKFNYAIVTEVDNWIKSLSDE